MTSDFSNLPAELQLTIIAHVPQLPAFALTSKTNYQIAAYTLLQRAINNRTCYALEKFHTVLRCLSAWTSPLALRDLYASSLLSRATTALNSNKVAEATRLVHLLPRLPKLTAQICLKPNTVDSFLYATRRMVIKAVGDEEKFKRLVGYLHMLPQGIVAPTGFFDDTLPHIREKAMKQLEKGRFMDAAYTILLVAQLPEDTKIVDGYFNYVISRLKAKALSAINAGRALSADNILSPIARLPVHKIAIGCFKDLFHSVRYKAMKQLQANQLRNACDTLAVLHAMREMGSISDRYFDAVLLKLQTLLVQSIADDKYDDAKQIVSLVGRPPSQMLGGCVDMTLTIHEQVRKAIDTGHLDRADSVLVLVVQFCETSIPKGRFDDLLPWIEERVAKAFNDGRKMDARALESAADLLYAKCIEETSLPNSVNPASTSKLLIK